MKKWISMLLMLAMICSLLPLQTGVSAAVTMVTQDGYLDFEAEDVPFDASAGRLELTAGDIYSGGQALKVLKEDKEGGTTQPADSEADLDLSFEADVAGTYTVWMRATATQDGSSGNSIYLSTGNNNYKYIQIKGDPSAPAWTAIGTVTASEGETARVRLRIRQNYNVSYDRFIITNDTSYVPNDSELGIGRYEKPFHVLAIGNSFSQDSVEHLYDVAEDCGADSIIIGNAFISGASISQHWANAQSGEAAYTYTKNTTGTRVTTENMTIKAALEDEAWDYITIQQDSLGSGQPDTYNDDLLKLIDYIKTSNPDAKLVWHMTWAYQSDSTHGVFLDYYHGDQMEMYNSIVDAVQEKIVPNEDIDLIIPTGTAIQNVRTSYIGDTLTRDGFHLSWYLGRYIASVTWVKALTGWSLDGLCHVPNVADIPEKYLPIIKEAVENAVATPFAVTPSSYTVDTSEPVQYLQTENGVLDVEAEDLEYDTEVFERASNKLFSGFGGLAPTKEHDKDVAPETIEPAHVDLTFEADEAGTYSIWMRHTGSVSNHAGQNLYLSLDGGKYSIANLSAEPEDPQWVKLGEVEVDEGGVGYVRLRVRQYFSIVYDRFIITNDETYVPDDAALGITDAVPDSSLRVLSIGNSFSGDAVEHLYKVAQDYGVQDIVIGNLAIGGSSIHDHWTNANESNASYGYYKNSIGVPQRSSNRTLLEGLTDEDWDIIVLQQQSSDSGLPETYNSDLTNLIEYVKKNRTNPDAKIFWDMTWAYQSDSTNAGFALFDNDQMKMYQAITGAVQEKIVTNSDIAGVIPTGTAVQNVRTSYIGDTLTRDGHHLSWNLGRYIASATWVKALTGLSADSLSYVPDSAEVPVKYLPIIKEAVENAVATPFAVTPSSYAVEPAVVSTVTDKRFAEAQGQMSGAIEVTVDTKDAVSGTCILAAYDGDGRLTALTQQDVSLSAGVNRISFENFTASAGNTYKVFLWDSVLGMEPICKELTGPIVN
ncbi:MAG TPA: DUF4886 domain-containing protein [Candidatus Aphodoplasma excrementigallinarum]|uniref:DUF4886 domain-containing protein n=1 Tax=Candidatus Aphodoplasma excrementigallinarum TaxID=2840673 RepID=A0A9D1NFH9_9FIRM|nr:DUF4886 domain-containing protein [Candidatus Aphodoplasma excrementigallinarum]